MKTSTSMTSLSKILAVLALPFLAGFALHASAGDIAQGDPHAPCGTLAQIGEQKFIYNNSNYSFNVIFETKFYKKNKISRFINAGAVKYLEVDANGQGVWRDTGVGDPKTTKAYTVPVANNSKVRITYCADSSMLEAYIDGTVFFQSIESDGEHNSPQGAVPFYGAAYSRSHQSVAFTSDGVTPFVSYNTQPSGNAEDGSLTICPKDIYCTVE